MEKQQKYSTVTAILPRRYLSRVVDVVTDVPGTSALVWDARGTLLGEQWYSRFLPSISPAKEIMQLLVPDYEVRRVVSSVVEEAKLHQQATGAVFCTGCEDVYFGGDFNRWPTDAEEHDDSHNLRENLDVIYCIVEPDRTDAVSRAAVAVGAHGPVVYYSDGRGLRDRLGWLRITKQGHKEVVTVLADSSDADEIFTAMAKAGQLHLPGRGFMYRMPVETGMFNLPSRVAHHHHAANMQQIINAIDHLSGHTHWRDQAVLSMGDDAKVAGIDFLTDGVQAEPETQLALTNIVPRSQSEAMIDLLLDAGAPGVNVSHARLMTRDAEQEVAGTRVHQEYSTLRVVTSERKVGSLHATVCQQAPMAGIGDVCMFTQPVGQIATYLPNAAKEYREQVA